MSFLADDEVDQNTEVTRRTDTGVDALGTVAVRGPNGSVPIAGRVERNLLALLVAHRGQSVDATLLVERVWGADAPEHASVQLRRAMRALARVVETVGVRIVGDGTWFDLDAPRGATDLEAFRGAVAAGRDHLAQDRNVQAAAALAESIGFWSRSSPFLDTGADRWPEAAELREELVNAIEDHADAHIAAGRPEHSLELLRLVARAQPLRESIAVLRMRALVLTGDVDMALDVFAEIERGLADALGLDPGRELVREAAFVRAEHLARSMGHAAGVPVPAEHARLRPA